MVDIVERNRLADMIVSLLKSEKTWDSLHEYFFGQESQDSAIDSIGWFFWVNLDPEYPYNRYNLSRNLVFRVILFLLSSTEYSHAHTDHTHDRYWPFQQEEDYKNEYNRNMEYVTHILGTTEFSVG